MPELLWIEQFWDKSRHAAAFFVMAALALRSLGYPDFSSRQCTVRGLWAVAYSVAVGAGIEFAQRHIPGRSSETADLVADLVGAAAAVILAIAFIRRRERLRRSSITATAGLPHASHT